MQGQLFEVDLYQKIDFIKKSLLFYLPESLLFVFDVLAAVRRVPVAEGGLSVDERLLLPSFRPRFVSPFNSDGGRFSSTKV